ncbi:MAG: DEAD/DEAH box helicase [Deltaproteobacteria bacterium]|nr:DEAD/DEAH box helicase [Deltaproteobacteria bacterium]MBW2418047.1 DEAD/DEAH box helicase [Deltaproteobacteria bacterium]
MNTDDFLPGVPAPLRTTMQRRGFSELTAVQRSVLEADGEGRNLRISSQTGSGKTVALGLVLARDFTDEAGAASASVSAGGPAVLIITPTRELAVQVRDELHWLYEDIPGLSVAVVTGGTVVWRERQMLARGPDLLVGTPGRILDHIRAGALDCSGVGQVVLDEADQMLDMGFREELEAIVEELPTKRRSHLVSATFPAPLRRLADRFQHDAVRVEGTRLGAANEDIEHVAYLVKPRERYAALVNLLLLSEGERCLVFVKRRVDAAEMAEKLAGDGFSALPLSGDLPQAQRTRTLNAFRTGIVSVLVATDVAARGIDVADISTVIHVEPPSDSDVYTHRSGRTGRAGSKGRSLLLIPASSRPRVGRLLASAKVDVQWQPAPAAAVVRKALMKGARRQIYGMLGGDDQPSEQQIAYAAKLLEGRDPAQVVATLIEAAQPRLPREPMEISAVDPLRDTRRPDAKRDFVRFFINWGHTSGATASRLLSHICRRGGIKGPQVGAIQIDRRSATFEVTNEVAAAFEQRVRQADPREPRVKIRRFSEDAKGAPAKDKRKGGAGRGAPHPTHQKRQRPDHHPRLKGSNKGKPAST